MNLEEANEEISEAIAWYTVIGCSSQDIETLLEKQGQIAGLSYAIAQGVAVDQSLYIVAHNQRKLAEAKKYVELKSEQKLSIVDAEKLAIVYGAQLRLDEAKAELDFCTGRTLLRQINKVLDAMTQRISYLKKEKELTFLPN